MNCRKKLKLGILFRSTALFLVSLFSLSIAETLTEKCRNIKTIHNFDPIKYFGRTWYATHTLYSHMNINEELACLKYESNLLDIDVIREIATAYFPKRKNILYNENYINLADFEDGIGQYSSTYRDIEKDERPVMSDFFPIQNNVVDTDYENYAVVYSCVMPRGRPIFTIYNILKRDSRAKSLDDKIVAILKEIGLKLDDFKRTGNKCDEV